MPDFDRPDVVAEVRDAFERYEIALRDHDAEALVTAFWDDERALRFGIAESSRGFVAIAAWRRVAPPAPARTLVEPRILTIGADVAVVDTEFVNAQDGARGRQSQVWARVGDEWRIVSAHVSMLEPD